MSTARRRTRSSVSVSASAHVGVGERAHPVQGSQRQFAGNHVVVGERRPRGRLVALVAGCGEPAPGVAHFFSMPVSVMTAHAAPKPITVAVTAPTQTASTLPATTAHTRRHQRVLVANGAFTAETSTPAGARRGHRARAGLAVALAGLRHPVAISATIARPASQNAAVESSVILTQSDIVTGEPGGVHAPGKGNRWWAVPLAVIGLAAIVAPIVAAVTPSKAFVEKPKCLERDADGVCTKAEQQQVEFALVPSNT